MQQAERIGKYQIQKVLGKGAAGQVFCAKQDQIDRLVALKILLPNVVESKPHFLERFFREARLIARLNHPNIIALFEMGKIEVDGLPLHYYTMEFVEDAVTLQDALAAEKGKGMPLDRALDIIEQLLDALALAHREGVIHRDLKPLNVLIDKERVPKVLDFGVSKAYDDEDLTVAGMIIGSPPYMSPEQARAQKCTVKSDIFSFGVMCYELFTGQRPLGGSTSRKDLILERQQYPKLPKDRMPKRIPQLVKGFPREIDRLVFAMLEGDPEKRPSAQRLREQVANFREGERRRAIEDELARAGQIDLPVMRLLAWKLSVAASLLIVAVGALAKWVR